MTEPFDLEAARKLFTVEYEDGEMISDSYDFDYSVWTDRISAVDCKETAESSGAEDLMVIEWIEASAALKEIKRLRAENAELQGQLNTPELHDFAAGVVSEAQHQRHRWGSRHDVGKTSSDWFWLIGYLAGKANVSHTLGDIDKALHHTITAAAALANWHAAIGLTNTAMRPGIDPAEKGVKP